MQDVKLPAFGTPAGHWVWHCSVVCRLIRFKLHFSHRLQDELPQNRDETLSLWTEAGDQYAAEEAGRDKRIKDQLDFPPDPPRHYPKHGNERLFHYIDSNERFRDFVLLIILIQV
jgi:hypothetical protein